MHHFKHIDIQGILGNATSLGLVGVSLANIETSLRILCLVGSLIVGWVTYKHTQEKRAFLKKAKKDDE